MSDNEIPNIFDDSVTLLNKPLSNLEIIDAAKRQSVNGFRGVFWRDTLPKKANLNECGILNLDSSSGDDTYWVMWFKKGKDKFYYDSYGVQPPSELIAYLKSPIFYNSERVQQNIALLCLLDLTAAFDTVNHGIIMQRLTRTFGIKDRALMWFDSYLTDRSTCAPSWCHNRSKENPL